MASDPERLFLQGFGRYLSDIKEDSIANLCFVRSPYAHANLIRVEAPRLTSLKIPFFRGVEVNKEVKKIPVIWEAEGMKMATQSVLAQEKVRYFGEPLAAVASTDLYASRDFTELVDVELEPLPATCTIEDSLKSGSPILHEQFSDKSNVGLSVKRTYGDPDKAFVHPEILIKETFKIGRVSPSPIEPRGVLATFNRVSGDLTVVSSTQIPFMLRRALSMTLGIPENRIRVVVPHVGGGFGGKDGTSPEEILASYAAIKLRKPVMWREERSENLTTAVHDRDQIQNVEVAATHDGVVKGLRAKIMTNAGAYYRYKGARAIFLTAYMVCGQYKIPNLDLESMSVLTNTLPTFPYRGPGSMQAIFMIERVMDLVARKTGLDPAEVRFRNMIDPDSFPFQTATGATYDSGNYQKCLKLVLERSRYREFAKEKEQARRKGRFIGIGLGLYVDQAGLGPTKLMSSLGISQGGWEMATVSIDQSGGVTVLTGVSAIGQGIERGIAKIVAEELSVDISKVLVKSGDTSLVSYGGGALASRSLSIAGTASLRASRKLKEKMFRIAAHVLEARYDDLVIENGRISVRGSPKTGLEISEIAQNSYLMKDMPEGEEPGLEESATCDPPNFTFPYGAMVAKVEVDLETGKVKLLSIDGVHDCGRIISLPDVEGQMLGGIAQGIGEALNEEIVYDDQGQPVTGSLTDYLLPLSEEMAERISLDHIETPSSVNPLGAKGVGESGIIGSPVAIVNAIENALNGVTILKIPVRPENLWRLINSSTN
jgi:aerobic carbon-monoxide dehydrogenase large subunit